VILDVRVVPGAARAGLAGVHGDALRIRVTARPIEGAANRELLRLLAALLGVAPSALTLAAGTHGRAKRIHVRGVTADAARLRLVPASSVDSPDGHN
jgi:uncharacterized protein (TIGR00251 family)